MPNNTRFVVTIYDLVYFNARVTRVLFYFIIFFYFRWISVYIIGFQAFQTFKHFSQEYSDSSVLVTRLIFLFIVSAVISLVFSMFIIIVYQSRKIIYIHSTRKPSGRHLSVLSIRSWYV